MKWKKPTWIAEKEWCNDTTLSFAQNAAEKGNIATVVCTGGTKFKAAITRFENFDLAGARAVVMDLNSGLPQGLSVALLLRPRVAKPTNRVRCSCGRAGIAIFVSRSI